MQIELDLRVTVDDVVYANTLPAGSYFIPELGVGSGIHRGVWQVVSSGGVTIPANTWAYCYLGLLDGLANGADIHCFDSSFKGYPITKELALAILAAQS